MTIAILALEKDLFFSVKIRDTLQHHGMLVTVVRTLAAFEQRVNANADELPALVILNISTPGVDWEKAIRMAHERSLPVLAFGSHMDLEARAKALQAGAQKVVANSKFARDMPNLVQGLLTSTTKSAATTDVDEEEEQG